jgi:endogenous inhibitor of DNA gyrase (YacG/DUF329 family)
VNEEEEGECPECGRYSSVHGQMCEGCARAEAADVCRDDPRDDYEDEGDDDFAEPGGRSALRAASESNPRNLPCPRCHAENVLTPKDRAHGYVCDGCADLAESGWAP